MAQQPLIWKGWVCITGKVLCFGADDSLKGMAALQSDLDKLEGWVITSEVQEGKVPDSASGMGQPWMCEQIGE